MSTDFTPMYHVIEQSLRARVATMKPHDPLPSESALCTGFAVSRMTARAAMLRLVADGLAYREPGRGTFVAPPPSQRRADKLLSFSEEMRREGRAPSARVVSAGIRSASAAEINRLKLSRGSQVLSICRVRLADDVPVAVESSLLPPELEALLRVDLARESLHTSLMRLGRVPSVGHASVRACNASPADVALLSIEPQSALLVEERLIVDADGCPLELTESRYAAGRYRLAVLFSVDHKLST